MALSKTKRTLLYAIAFFLFLILFGPSIFVPWIINSQIQSRTHYTIDFGDINVSLWRGLVHIKDTHIYNSKEFPSENFIAIKEVKIHAHPLSLFTGKKHFKEIICNIDNITFVKDKEGNNNVDTFLKRMRESFGIEDKKASKKPASNEKKSAQSQFLVERLMISFNTVAAVLPQEGEKEPLRVDSQWNIQKEYTDITQDNLNTVTLPLTLELSTKGIGLLAKIVTKKALSETQNMGESALKTIGTQTGEVIEEAAKTIQGLFGK